jgi:hypothetical protein
MNSMRAEGKRGAASFQRASGGVSIECTFSFAIATTEPFERTNTYLLSMKMIVCEDWERENLNELRERL